VFIIEITAKYFAVSSPRRRGSRETLSQEVICKDRNKESNGGTVLAYHGKKVFLSTDYWIPVFPASARTGMTNTEVLQLA